MRKQQKELRKTNRELERDRGGLERQEKQIVSGRRSRVMSLYTIIDTTVVVVTVIHCIVVCDSGLTVM